MMTSKCADCGDEQRESAMIWLPSGSPVCHRCYDEGLDPPVVKHSHYHKNIAALESLDIYRILKLYDVTDPCLQHIVKKALCAGRRGAKDFTKDVQEIADTAQRCLEMIDEDKTE